MLYLECPLMDSAASEPWCSGCRQLQSQLDTVQKEHLVNFKALKDKIFSTDLLIKKYNTKCKEYDAQTKKLEDTNKKVEGYQSDFEMMTLKLKSTLEEMEPLKQAKEKLEKKKASLEKQLEQLKPQLSSSELIQNQYRLTQSKLDKEMSSLDQERKQLRQSVKEMEVSLKKAEATQKRLQDDHDARKQSLTEYKKSNSRLSKHNQKLQNQLSKCEELMRLNGLHVDFKKLIRRAGGVGSEACSITSSIAHTADFSSEDESAISDDDDIEEILQKLGFLGRAQAGTSSRSLVTRNLLEPIAPALSPLPCSPAPHSKAEDSSSSEEEEGLSESTAGEEGVGPGGRDPHGEEGSHEDPLHDLANVLESQLLAVDTATDSTQEQNSHSVPVPGRAKPQVTHPAPMSSRLQRNVELAAKASQLRSERVRKLASTDESFAARRHSKTVVMKRCQAQETKLGEEETSGQARVNTDQTGQTGDHVANTKRAGSETNDRTTSVERVEEADPTALEAASQKDREVAELDDGTSLFSPKRRTSRCLSRQKTVKQPDVSDGHSDTGSHDQVIPERRRLRRLSKQTTESFEVLSSSENENESFAGGVPPARIKVEEITGDRALRLQGNCRTVSKNAKQVEHDLEISTSEDEFTPKSPRNLRLSPRLHQSPKSPLGLSESDEKVLVSEKQFSGTFQRHPSRLSPRLNPGLDLEMVNSASCKSSQEHSSTGSNEINESSRINKSKSIFEEKEKCVPNPSATKSCSDKDDVLDSTRLIETCSDVDSLMTVDDTVSAIGASEPIKSTETRIMATSFTDSSKPMTATPTLNAAISSKPMKSADTGTVTTRRRTRSLTKSLSDGENYSVDISENEKTKTEPNVPSPPSKDNEISSDESVDNVNNICAEENKPIKQQKPFKEPLPVMPKTFTQSTKQRITRSKSFPGYVQPQEIDQKEVCENPELSAVAGNGDGISNSGKYTVETNIEINHGQTEVSLSSPLDPCLPSTAADTFDKGKKSSSLTADLSSETDLARMETREENQASVSIVVGQGKHYLCTSSASAPSRNSISAERLDPAKLACIKSEDSSADEVSEKAIYHRRLENLKSEKSFAQHSTEVTEIPFSPQGAFAALPSVISPLPPTPVKRSSKHHTETIENDKLRPADAGSERSDSHHSLTRATTHTKDQPKKTTQLIDFVPQQKKRKRGRKRKEELAEVTPKSGQGESSRILCKKIGAPVENRDKNVLEENVQKTSEPTATKSLKVNPKSGQGESSHVLSQKSGASDENREKNTQEENIRKISEPAATKSLKANTRIQFVKSTETIKGTIQEENSQRDMSAKAESSGDSVSHGTNTGYKGTNDRFASEVMTLDKMLHNPGSSEAGIPTIPPGEQKTKKKERHKKKRKQEALKQESESPPKKALVEGSLSEDSSLEPNQQFIKMIDRELQSLERVGAVDIEQVALHLASLKSFVTTQVFVDSILKFVEKSEADVLMTEVRARLKQCDQTTPLQWTPVLTALEERLLALLTQVDKHMPDLCDILLRSCADHIVHSSTLHVLSKSALCRLYAALTHQHARPECLRVLLYDLTYFKVTGVYALLAQCAVVWPEALRATEKRTQEEAESQAGELEQPIETVLHWIFLRQPWFQGTPRQQVVIQVLQRLCGWRHVSHTDTQLVTMVLTRMDRLLRDEQLTEKQSVQLFECVSCLKLIAVHKGWEWTYSHLIHNTIWPRIQAHLASGNNSHVTSTRQHWMCRLLGELSLQCPRQEKHQLDEILQTLQSFCTGDHASTVGASCVASVLDTVMLLTPYNPPLATEICKNWLKSQTGEDGGAEKTDTQKDRIIQHLVYYKQRLESATV